MLGLAGDPTCPSTDPSKADLIDGSIGEKSPFHDTFGYYAHGVSPETAKLPSGWKQRLVRGQNENTNGVVGLCLSAGDLAISKLLASRDKDREFVSAMLRHKLVSCDDLNSLTRELPQAAREAVEYRLRAIASDS